MGCNCGGSAQVRRQAPGAPAHVQQPNPQAGGDGYFWTGPERAPEPKPAPAPKP